MIGNSRRSEELGLVFSEEGCLERKGKENNGCAADAAFRASCTATSSHPLMAAFTSKRRDVSRGEITARISGRSHLINEKEAKNYNSLCGGEGSKMATQAMPPSPKLAEFPPKSAGLASLTT